MGKSDFRKWLLPVAASLFVSCAGAPKVAPRFVAPSTAPIARAQAAIAVKQAETRGHIQKAQVIVKTLTIRVPEDQVKVDALSTELNGAWASNEELKIENDGLKGSNDALTTQLAAQTQQANKLADDYDKQHQENAKLRVTVDKVNRYWGLGAFGYGFARLAKHLFILGIVIAVLAAALFALSFLFPVIGVAFGAVVSVIKRIFQGFVNERR